MNITKNSSSTFYGITTTDDSTLQQYQEPNKGKLVARTVAYFIPEKIGLIVRTPIKNPKRSILLQEQ